MSTVLAMTSGRIRLPSIWLTHQIEGNVIHPLVIARMVKLHPATVAIGVVAVDRLFGVLGLIVSVPILVTAKILIEELWIKPMEQSHQTAATDPEGPQLTEVIRVPVAPGQP